MFPWAVVFPNVPIMQEEELRAELKDILGIPSEGCDLQPESRGLVGRDGIVIEKWIWTSEEGSRIPSVLYLPKVRKGKVPAIVLTFGHGGSKSSWQYVYMAQLYAKMGVACLALDPIGEEERNSKGDMGTRDHDRKPVIQRADAAGRMIMGKLVFDTMRGIDYLLTREDIDHTRIGVGGNSLGGAKAGWMLGLDTRIRMALVSGWAFGDHMLVSGKLCTTVPNKRLRERCNWPEYISLAAPHCAVLILNGDADVIIDRNGDGTAWRETLSNVAETAEIYKSLGAGGKIQCWFEKKGGHRPYPACKVALEWIHKYLGTPGWNLEEIHALPTINSGQWCDANKVELERLYGTDLHQRGATLPDLGLGIIPREDLACLRPDEIGDPQYTLEGWLDAIEKRIT